MLKDYFLITFRSDLKRKKNRVCGREFVSCVFEILIRKTGFLLESLKVLNGIGSYMRVNPFIHIVHTRRL